MQPSVFVFTFGTPDLYDLPHSKMVQTCRKRMCKEACKFLQAVPTVEEFLKRFTMARRLFWIWPARLSHRSH
jgi:hypothetical protein